MTDARGKISVSIVEDDAGMRALYAGWLDQSEDFVVVGQHGNGLEAVAAVPGENPDVVLMDINLPGIDGVECVRQLKARHPKIQFVMITVFEDPSRIFNALAAGATGYMLKQTPREEILTALREVYRGGSPMSSSIARRVVRCFRASVAPAAGEDLALLSPREEEVLELLSQGYLYKEISAALGISGHTVDTYLRRIYEKLHVKSRAQATALYEQMRPRPGPRTNMPRRGE